MDNGDSDNWGSTVLRICCNTNIYKLCMLICSFHNGALFCTLQQYWNYVRTYSHEPPMQNTYHRWGKIRWAKSLWFQCHRSFCRNISHCLDHKQCISTHYLGEALIFMEKLLQYSWKPWKTRKFSPANLSPFTVLQWHIHIYRNKYDMWWSRCMCMYMYILTVLQENFWGQ